VRHFSCSEQGAKSMHQELQLRQLKFTSNLEVIQDPGDWGGLLIMGKSTIKQWWYCNKRVVNFTYGGTDTNDNSGVFYLMLF
jgi:hypothetical protein